MLCTIVVCEIALRVFGRFEPPPPTPVARRTDLYAPDSEVGYTLRPSSQTTYTYPIGSSHVLSLVSNASGFRSPREIDEPDSRTRIWVLGDSMVLGDGVPVTDRLTEVMETLEPRWRVDNLGMTGWGLDLMVRATERALRRVRPDVVVLAFYTDDFRRLQPYYSGQGYAIPKFELSGGRLRSVPFPTMPFWRRLRVIQAVEQGYWRVERNRFDLNGALIARLRLSLAQVHTSLAVVFLPGRSDTDEDRTRRTWLLRWCDGTGTPFLDLTETIHGAGVENVYIQNNPHWNEKGHRLAGEAIQRFVNEKVLKH